MVLARTAQLQQNFRSLEIEVIIVNDGSVSPTFAEGKKRLDRPHISVLEYEPNQGKGEALRTGVKAAQGDLFVYTDIDFPYTNESMAGLIDQVNRGGADIVIGVKDAGYYAHLPPARRFISKFFRYFIRLFFRMPTDDTQCGLKCFNQKGRSIFLSTSIKSYLFDLEFVFLASRQTKVRISTYEIHLSDDVRFRRMDFKILSREAMNFIKILAAAIIR